ncbi:MAG: hypothetical protein ACHQ1H_12795, partial [Nitrososphaerales archaeon]
MLKILDSVMLRPKPINEIIRETVAVLIRNPFIPRLEEPKTFSLYRLSERPRIVDGRSFPMCGRYPVEIGIYF